MKTISFILLLFSCLQTNAQTLIYLQNDSLYVENGLQIYSDGGLNISGSSNIVLHGTFHVTDNSGSGGENWIDNTTGGAISSNSTGDVIFQSSGMQVFSGNTKFYNLEINNPAGVQLNNNLEVRNNLTLTNGVVNTGAFRLFVSNGNSNAISAGTGNTNYSQSWVNGNLRRNIFSNNSSYDFPVGNASQNNLLVFGNNNLSGVNYLDASFGAKPGNDAGLNVTERGTNYLSVNNGGVWYLTPDANPTGGSYNLKLFFNGFSGMNDDMFSILRRNDASSNAADWIVPVNSSLPTSGSAGRIVSSGFALRNGLTTFSQFGIGESGAPLPVQLISFRGWNEGTVNHLQWETSSEINSDFFDVQRTNNLTENFSSIGKVDAAGISSSLLTYNFIDENPFSGKNIYRLSLVDKNGNQNLSNVVEIDLNEMSSVISAFPNPATDNIQLTINSSEEKNSSIEIMDELGRIIYSREISLVNGNKQFVFDTKDFAAGNYFISISAEGKLMKTIKFVKE